MVDVHKDQPSVKTEDKDKDKDAETGAKIQGQPSVGDPTPPSVGGVVQQLDEDGNPTNESGGEQNLTTPELEPVQFEAYLQSQRDPFYEPETTKEELIENFDNARKENEKKREERAEKLKADQKRRADERGPAIKHTDKASEAHK